MCTLILLLILLLLMLLATQKSSKENYARLYYSTITRRAQEPVAIKVLPTTKDPSIYINISIQIYAFEYTSSIVEISSSIESNRFQLLLDYKSSTCSSSW